jgi:hypothetical protein
MEMLLFPIRTRASTDHSPCGSQVGTLDRADGLMGEAWVTCDEGRSEYSLRKAVKGDCKR